MQPGGGALRQVTARHICRAYAESTGVEAKNRGMGIQNEILGFRHHFASLKSAAAVDDDSICTIGACRMTYDTIEAFIRGAGKRTDLKVRAAAEWCVANLNAIPRQTSLCQKKETLLRMWENDPPLAVCSLQSERVPLSMQKLLDYASSASGGGGGAEASAPCAISALRRLRRLRRLR